MALTFDDGQSKSLLETLGLPTDTTDTALILSTGEDLAAQVAAIDPAKPSTIAAAAKTAGLEVMDTASAEALRRDASEGRRMAAAAEQQRIEASVDDAIRKGKITPARRKHWVTLIGADPGMAEVLASVPDETAGPLTEVGHGTNPDPGAGGGPNDDDAWVI